MRIVDRNWMQVEEYLERDDRIVLPLGSTEQHAYLSLGTDSILAERVATEAAEPAGVAVLPALAYGVCPLFAAYPGSPSLGLDTFASVVRELVASLQAQGFRRVLLVNGHGGNSPAAERVAGDGVLWHDWWRSPRVSAVVREIDPVGAHASWFENFPWTRLPGVEAPTEAKAPIEREQLRGIDAPEARRLLGDGSFGGRYARSDEEMLRIWRTGVDEVRELLENGWDR
jgi:creatinine amidohydrolase